MNTISRRLITFVITLAAASLATAIARPKTHSLDEDGALNLLLGAIKRDQVYAKRISLDCVTFAAEDTTRIYFVFVLRENHNAKCGGDPDLSPAIDRYRVYRASGKIEWLDRVADKWQPYTPAQIK